MANLFPTGFFERESSTDRVDYLVLVSADTLIFNTLIILTFIK